jgi:hypothetical protein
VDLVFDWYRERLTNKARRFVPGGLSFQNLAVRLARMTIAAVGGTVRGKFFNLLKQENPECKFARRSKT